MIKNKVDLNFETYLDIPTQDLPPESVIDLNSDNTAQVIQDKNLMAYVSRYAAPTGKIEFNYNIFGTEGVGKSSFGLLLSLTLSKHVKIKRVQLESTVVQKELYDMLTPVNPHRAIPFVANGIMYYRLYPILVSQKSLIEYAKKYTYLFVDGCSRLQSENARLAERGINLAALEFCVIELPNWANLVCTFTIASEPIRRDIAGTSQGFFEVKDRTTILVTPPHDRLHTYTTSWNDALEVFHGRPSNNYGVSKLSIS